MPRGGEPGKGIAGHKLWDKARSELGTEPQVAEPTVTAVVSFVSRGGCMGRLVGRSVFLIKI